MEYDDGCYSGVLALDHTTIRTEPAGYTSGSYTIRETKEIGNLNSNDMSYVPQTTVKDGKTIQLENVEWKVQSTALVDDVLVPSSYVAVATYSGKGTYNTATGYVSTAEYKGTVACKEIRDVTYTVLYTGAKVSNSIEESVVEATRSLSDTVAENRTPFLIGGVALAALLGVGTFLLLRSRKPRYAGYVDYRGSEEDKEETEHEDDED